MTKPTDFAIMNGAHAIITVYPGRTSHAAITAMSMNKPCIVGCDDAEIDYENRCVTFRGPPSVTLSEGERVTADGNTGALYRGVAPISEFFLPLSRVIEEAARCSTGAEAADKVQGLIRSEMADMRRRTSPRRKSLEEAESLEGLRVLVRVDANIEVREGRVVDERRVLQMLPTLRLLLEKGATPIACSHLGDPGASPDARFSREELYRDYSLKPVADILRRRLGDALVFHTASVGASGLLVSRKDIVPGAVNLLENLRFATGEKDNDEAFARSLAELSDGWFVNDAFNVSQRRHASITGVPRFVSRRLAGLAVARELSVLARLLDDPPRPFTAVIVGEETEAQFGVMAALLPRVDRLAILAPRNPDAGAAPDAEGRPGQRAAESMIEGLRADNPEKVLLPRGRPTRLVRALDESRTVLWSGPAALASYSENEEAETSSLKAHERALHRALRRGALVVVLSEKEKQIADVRGPDFHLSSGPRAFREYLERLSLPGITALESAESRPSL